MTVNDDKLINYAGWARGIDNISPQMVRRDALAAAENVDIDKAGKISRRKGYTKKLDLTNAHSLWSHPNFPYMLYADGASLYAIDQDLNTTELADDLNPYLPLSYTYLNGSVAWTNSVSSARISPGLSTQSLGLQNPVGQPKLTAISSGGLEAGTYQVAITFIAYSGEESGSTLAGLVTVSSGGGIQLANIPQPDELDIRYIRIYVSPCNGDGLYHYRDIATGITTWNVGASTPGKLLETQWLEKLPAGQFIRHLNDRLFVARKNVLIYSEALRYGLFNRAYSYFKEADRITLLEPVGQGTQGAGLYLAAGKRTYFMSGGSPNEMRRVIAYPHGAVEGSGVTVPLSIFPENVVGNNADFGAFWLASNGVFCLGLPSGQVVALTEKRYLAPNAELGAAMLREQDGLRQIITGLKGRSDNGIRPTDSVTAKVYRHGVVV